jgi:hypothetical protein
MEGVGFGDSFINVLMGVLGKHFNMGGFAAALVCLTLLKIIMKDVL